MHAEVYEWVRQYAPAEPGAVLEIGGLNVNGTIRDHFPNADPYHALDMADGEGVDIVADATSWEPDREYDTVVTTGMLEHLEDWRLVIDTAYKALRPGGLLLLTCAGPGWKRHGMHGASAPEADEWYQNVDPAELKEALSGWSEAIVEMGGCYNADLSARATK